MFDVMEEMSKVARVTGCHLVLSDKYNQQTDISKMLLDSKIINISNVDSELVFNVDKLIEGSVIQFNNSTYNLNQLIVKCSNCKLTTVDCKGIIRVYTVSDMLKSCSNKLKGIRLLC